MMIFKMASCCRKSSTITWAMSASLCPADQRIGLQSSDSSSVLSTAFRTPVGEIVVVAMNPWDGPAHIDLRDVARAGKHADGPAASFDRDAHLQKRFDRIPNC